MAMSCSLYWRPVGGGNQVGGSQLREAIREEFGSDTRLDMGALPFLRGLAAAGMEGARQLIAAIEKHDVIETYLEC